MCSSDLLLRKLGAAITGKSYGDEAAGGMDAGGIIRDIVESVLGSGRNVGGAARNFATRAVPNAARAFAGTEAGAAAISTAAAGALILGGAYGLSKYNTNPEVARKRLQDSQAQFEQENAELEALRSAYEEEQATLDAMGKDDPKRRQQEQMVAGFKQRLDELQASRDKDRKSTRLNSSH